MKAATLAGYLRSTAFGLPALALLGSGAQQPAAQSRPIGTVSATNATVSSPDGMLPVSAGSVTLAGSSIVTAKQHTADITLARGGTVAVCRSSMVHLTAAAAASGPSPLLMAIDKGALEVQMRSVPGDVILTPDLRLTTPSGGPLDLALDVTASGDTCINNRGPSAPVIEITDAFGETSYQVKPDQHVLFEHGDLHAVVDRETTPCGCPPEEKQPVSIAEALLASHGTMTPAEAQAVHPFPAAVSSGLAEPTPVPAETPDTHVQVATTLTYNPAAPPPEEPETAAATPVPPKRGEAKPKKKVNPTPVAAPRITQSAANPSPPQIASLGPAAPPSMAPILPATPPPQVKQSSVPRPLRAIGRFFKRIFVD